jgi:hypothetical protein
MVAGENLAIKRKKLYSIVKSVMSGLGRKYNKYLGYFCPHINRNPQVGKTLKG